jgi:hypothetical protein
MTLEGRFSHGGNVKTFVAAFAVCFMNYCAISKPGMALWQIDLPVSLHAICGKSRYFYKKVFSGMLPLKSKIRLNVIPSPGFKLVVLFGFCEDSWVFLNVFLNGKHFFIEIA